MIKPRRNKWQVEIQNEIQMDERLLGEQEISRISLMLLKT